MNITFPSLSKLRSVSWRQVNKAPGVTLNDDACVHSLPATNGQNLYSLIKESGRKFNWENPLLYALWHSVDYAYFRIVGNPSRFLPHIAFIPESQWLRYQDFGVNLIFSIIFSFYFHIRNNERWVLSSVILPVYFRLKPSSLIEIWQILQIVHSLTQILGTVNTKH